MDTVLTVIGILGLGALIIAAWVFVSAAKRYVTGEDLREEMEALQSDLSPYKHWVDRSKKDRRKDPNAAHGPMSFPAVIDGILIKEDRRQHPDRRHAA
jgi:hypothetical protein